MDPLVRIDLLPKHRLRNANGLFSGGSRRNSSIHTLREAWATGLDPSVSLPVSRRRHRWCGVGGDNSPTLRLRMSNRRPQRNRGIARSWSVMERYVVGNSASWWLEHVVAAYRGSAELPPLLSGCLRWINVCCMYYVCTVIIPVSHVDSLCYYVVVGRYYVESFEIWLSVEKGS